MGSSVPPLTELLNNLRGDTSANSQLVSLVYPELRRLAATYMKHERRGHTLQPTALVNEAYFRLVGAQGEGWANRAHFFAAAAQAMRAILVDHARKNNSLKRGGAVSRVDLEMGFLVAPENLLLVLEVHNAINALATLDARQALIVEMRFFGGMTEDQIAEVLKINSRTVKRDWRMARAWLHSLLAGRENANDA